MTLRMADGPVANLPPGLDAYAGYVNQSGIGVTFPGVVAKFPDAQHLSITTDGAAAMCADVEKGAMSGWLSYTYGYCSVSSVNALLNQYGRPRKLWTAHYDAALGAHICSPQCWPGLETSADGTQWIDHGGWDESLLRDDFFVIQPLPKEEEVQLYATDSAGTGFVVSADLSHKVGLPDPQDAAALLKSGQYVQVTLTDALLAKIPGS